MAPSPPPGPQTPSHSPPHEEMCCIRDDGYATVTDEPAPARKKIRTGGPWDRRSPPSQASTAASTPASTPAASPALSPASAPSTGAADYANMSVPQLRELLVGAGGEGEGQNDIG